MMGSHLCGTGPRPLEEHGKNWAMPLESVTQSQKKRFSLQNTNTSGPYLHKVNVVLPDVDVNISSVFGSKTDNRF